MKITSVKPKGKKQVYSLSMRSEPHNYALANGLVSKNSHAISYAFISYWTAYFKKNYPAEYMAALLGSVRNNIDKAGVYLGEAREMGLSVLPPSINHSSTDFKVISENEILFGLSSITGIGDAIVDKLLAAREKGEIKTLHELFRAADPDILNRGTFNKLLYSGALDEILPPQEEKPISREEKMDLLLRESDSLGMWITEHPLEGIWSHLEPQITHRFSDFEHLPHQERVSTAGIITSVNKRYTKRGDKMYIVYASDVESTCEIVIFPQMADGMEEPYPGQVFIFKGRVQHESEASSAAKMTLTYIEEPSLPDTSFGAPIMVVLSDSADNNTVSTMLELIDNNPGDHPVFLTRHEGQHMIKMQLKKPASKSIEKELQFIGSSA